MKASVVATGSSSCRRPLQFRQLKKSFSFFGPKRRAGQARGQIVDDFCDGTRHRRIPSDLREHLNTFERVALTTRFILCWTTVLSRVQRLTRKIFAPTYSELPHKNRRKHRPTNLRTRHNSWPEGVNWQEIRARSMVINMLCLPNAPELHARVGWGTSRICCASPELSTAACARWSCACAAMHRSRTLTPTWWAY